MRLTKKGGYGRVSPPHRKSLACRHYKFACGTVKRMVIAVREPFGFTMKVSATRSPVLMADRVAAVEPLKITVNVVS